MTRQSSQHDRGVQCAEQRDQRGGDAHCSQCGAAFACGRDDPAGCWCAQLPPLNSACYRPAADCLCPACLRNMLVSSTSLV